jgi:hypothetical protein
VGWVVASGPRLEPDVVQLFILRRGTPVLCGVARGEPHIRMLLVAKWKAVLETVAQRAPPQYAGAPTGRQRPLP